MKLLKEAEEFELKHRIISFILIVIITIALTRIIVSIKDPNPIIRGYELHHFYYGIILLMIISLSWLFGHKHYKIYLTLTAISIGLIIDQFLYVAGGFGNTQIYSSTLSSAIVFASVIIIIIAIIKLDVLKRLRK